MDLGQGNGASATAGAVTSCYPANWGCGDHLNLVPGKKVGQITSGTLTLIHQGAGCAPSGQDTITFNGASTPPYTITGGSGNPYGLSGKTITTSDSIVTVPVYDGTHTGSGTNKTFTIIGFMQIFITDACHVGTERQYHCCGHERTHLSVHFRRLQRCRHPRQSGRRFCLRRWRYSHSGATRAAPISKCKPAIARSFIERA